MADMASTVYRLYDIYDGKHMVAQSSELDMELFRQAARKYDKETDGECTMIIRKVTVDEIPFTY